MVNVINDHLSGGQPYELAYNEAVTLMICTSTKILCSPFQASFLETSDSISSAKERDFIEATKGLFTET